jgi:hypothetical protein
MTVPFSRTSPQPRVHRIVHRSELAAVHRPSATVVQHDCGHPTARGETWQASVPVRYADRQPLRPEDVVFEETSVGSTRSRGLQAQNFFAPEVREPKFSTPGISDPGGSDPPGSSSLDSGVRVCDSERMTDVCRQSSIGSEECSGFRRHWPNACARKSAERTSVTVEEARPEEVDRSRRQRERTRGEHQAGKKTGGKKMGTPRSPKFRRPGPFSCQ